MEKNEASTVKSKLAWSILALGIPFLAGAQALSPHQRLARDIHKELVEINTVTATGDTAKAAEAMAARLRSAGFPAADVQVFTPAPRKGNLVVRLRGSGARRPLLLLAHLDVVEAKREDWSVDPFTLLEKDGYFYGRGTGDDKAQAAIWVANLIRYKQEGLRPARDLIVALTADEEGGGPFNGVDWLLKNRRELIDAEYCLNEGGWGDMVNGKHVANNVQVSEKYVANYRLEVKNKGGHSSLPVPDNAIYHLAEALVRISKYKFPVKTNEVTKAYLEQMAKVSPEPIAGQMKSAAQGSEDAAEQLT